MFDNSIDIESWVLGEKGRIGVMRRSVNVYDHIEVL